MPVRADPSTARRGHYLDDRKRPPKVEGIASVRVNAVSLAVSDPTSSSAFYEALGWRRLGVSYSETAVLTAPPSPALILNRADRSASTSGSETKPESASVVLVMIVNSPEEVHETLASAVRAGATVLRAVTQLGYGCHAYFADLDGHVWEVLETPGYEVAASGELSVP